MFTEKRSTTAQPIRVYTESFFLYPNILFRRRGTQCDLLGGACSGSEIFSRQKGEQSFQSFQLKYRYEFIISKLTLADPTTDTVMSLLCLLFPSCRVWFSFCPIDGSNAFAGDLLLFIGHLLDPPRHLASAALIPVLSDRWQWCLCWWPAAFYWPPSGPTPPPLQG